MDSLRELSERRGVAYGCAVNLAALMNDPLYGPAVARECAVIVPENNGKFGLLSREPNKHDFHELDQIVDFGRDHGMRVRGHTLVWHQQAPRWLLEGGYAPDQVRHFLEQHILKTVDRYRGRIESWDVVNEAVDDSAVMRDTFWLQNLGPDYIEWAFRLAREVDPACELVYNDYSIEEVNPKSDRVFSMVHDLLHKGVPIHGIGMQAHLELSNPPDLESVRRNIRRFRELELRVLVTEMDVRIPEPFEDDKFIEQGELYEGFVRVCLQEGVRRILTWGLTDRYSWIPGFFKGTGEALLLDEDMEPKPAYHGVAAALKPPTRAPLIITL